MLSGPLRFTLASISSTPVRGTPAASAMRHDVGQHHPHHRQRARVAEQLVDRGEVGALAHVPHLARHRQQGPHAPAPPGRRGRPAASAPSHRARRPGAHHHRGVHIAEAGAHPARRPASRRARAGWWYGPGSPRPDAAPPDTRPMIASPRCRHPAAPGAPGRPPRTASARRLGGGRAPSPPAAPAAMPSGSRPPPPSRHDSAALPRTRFPAAQSQELQPAP